MAGRQEGIQIVGPHVDLDYMPFSWQHPDCSPEQEVMVPVYDAIEKAIRLRDVKVLDAMMKSRPGLFTINLERSAIQINACDNSIAGHWSVPRDLAEQLIQ